MKLIIYGNSDFAELMYYYFSTDSIDEVVAFCVDRAYLTDATFLDKPQVAFEDLEANYPVEKFHVFVAVGYKSMRLRKRLFDKVKSKGYKCANYISTKACIDESNILGENNALLHHVVLEPFAKLGDNNIINTKALICHHAEIKNDCFVAANSVIGGFTRVNNNCFIGFSTTVLQKLTIEKETLLAAGTLMHVDSKAYTMYAGVPAKEIREHAEDGILIKG